MGMLNDQELIFFDNLMTEECWHKDALNNQCLLDHYCSAVLVEGNYQGSM
jgi:hypothetical protein